MVRTAYGLRVNACVGAALVSQLCTSSRRAHSSPATGTRNRGATLLFLISASPFSAVTLFKVFVPFDNRMDRHEEALDGFRSSCHEEAACARAMAHGSPHYRTVKTILATGTDQRADSPATTPQGYGRTRFTRPSAAIEMPGCVQAATASALNSSLWRRRRWQPAAGVAGKVFTCPPRVKRTRASCLHQTESLR